MSRDFDVAIIGTGIAGHCAALTALQAGARVLMLDTEPVIGGSSKLSTGMIMGAATRFQKQRGIDDDPALLYRHYMAVNQLAVMPAVAKRLCYDVGPTIEWLNDHDVKILDVIPSGEEDRARGHVTEGGAAIVNALAGHVGTFNTVDVALKSRVERLMGDENGVSGVVVDGNEITAGAVVIACGGFTANHELVARWYPDAIPAAAGTLTNPGTPWAKGDGFLFADQVKAQIARGRGSRSPMWGFGGSYLPSPVIVVNQLGRRFYAETSSYGAAEIVIAMQPSAIAFIVFDQSIRRSFKSIADVKKRQKVVLPETEHLLSGWTDAMMDDVVARGELIKADSIEQLAQRIGVPPQNLCGTVERYNTHVAAGEDRDFLKAPEGLLPIAEPPFYAGTIKLYMLALTSVGPRIDADACVLHETGRPVPGLYAAGECAGGVLGSIYVGSGNSLANCTTYGRIAGRSAAAYAQRNT